MTRALTSIRIAAVLGMGCAILPAQRLPEDPLRQLAAVAIATPVADGVPILVVDENGDALANALVVVVDRADSLDKARLRTFMNRMSAWLGDDLRQAAVTALHASTCYRTGNDGTVRVRLAAEQPFTAVKAIVDDRLAEELVAADATSARLLALPERAVQVTVVDGDGRPVPGIHVGLCAAGQATLLREAVTDAAGAAHLTEPRFVRRLASGSDVGVAIPLREPVRSRVSWRSYSATTVTLQVPALGQIVVHAPAELPGPVFLRSRDGRTMWRGDPLDARRTRFQVGLDLELVAVAGVGDRSEITAPVRGPVAAHEGVTVTLPLPSPGK